MGLDPGYAHGCKVAVVDEIGRVLDTAVIYPVPPRNKVEEAKATIKKMIERNHVQVIAIGNGDVYKRQPAWSWSRQSVPGRTEFPLQ